MARLKSNGEELLRYKEIITYPIDNCDCIQDIVRTYSVRSNGKILRKITTRYNVTDGLLHENYTSGWKIYAKIKSGYDIKDRIAIMKQKVVNAKTYHLKDNAILSFELS